MGWTKSSGHLVFDVKMDFIRKAQWVNDGHKISDPHYSLFSGVVSRESVCIALTFAALSNIQVMLADMPIFKHHLQKSTTLFVGPSLNMKTLGNMD